MTINGPLVSVLMTAFNRELFIAEAIESVLNSTFKDFELIVVDDCSKDKTVDIARKYESMDKRVRVFRNDENLGDYPNRNRALSIATGEYIMFVDSDDKILIDGIQQCVDWMIKYPESNFGIFSTMSLEMNIVNSIESLQLHFFKKPFLIVGPGGTIQKTKFARQIGGYPTKYGPANDMYYHLKVACHTPIVLLPFEFMYYRRHDGQEINNKYSYLINNYNYLRDALLELPFPLTSEQKRWILKKNKRRFFTNLVIFFLGTRDFKKLNKAINETQFSSKNVLEAIFQF